MRKTTTDADQMKRRVLSGRAFAFRDEDEVVIYRARDRRTLRLGHLPSEAFTQEIAEGSVSWREGWLAKEAHGRGAGVARLSHPLEIPKAPQQVPRQSAFQRVLQQIDSPGAVRLLVEAARRLASDVERAASSDVRTMAWAGDMRINARNSGGGPQNGFAPSKALAARRVAQLQSRYDGAEWQDLSDMIIGQNSLSSLARRRGQSRPVMEARLAGLLQRLARAYALSLPAEAA